LTFLGFLILPFREVKREKRIQEVRDKAKKHHKTDKQHTEKRNLIFCYGSFNNRNRSFEDDIVGIADLTLMENNIVRITGFQLHVSVVVCGEEGEEEEETCEQAMYKEPGRKKEAKKTAYLHNR
jgi:hypothetical protein